MNKHTVGWVGGQNELTKKSKKALSRLSSPEIGPVREKSAKPQKLRSLKDSIDTTLNRCCRPKMAKAEHTFNLHFRNPLC